MNLRNVLRAYGLLRNLSDDESALLNILRALNDSDREALMLSMSDKPQKKSSKKAVGKSATKSTRASGMAAQLNKQLDRRRKATPDDNGDDGRCTFRFEDGSICDQKADVNIHHLSTWAHYHPFVSPVPDAADSLDQPTIETGTDSAGTAASAGG